MSLMTRCACRAVIRARATCSNVSARFCAFLLSVSFVLRCTRVPSAWIKQANQYLEPRFLRIDATSPILFGPSCFLDTMATKLATSCHVWRCSDVSGYLCTQVTQLEEF